MTIDDFNKKCEELKRVHDNAYSELVKQCALANNTHEVGTVVEDHIGKIRIEKISTTTNYSKPTCVYYGIELKKDGTPTKKGTKRQVWQINLPENRK
jgi:hypothetical protein